MKLTFLFLIPIAVLAKDSFNNYGDGIDARDSSKPKITIVIPPGIKQTTQPFINFISDDIADDELDKVISNQASVGALARGKERVYDAIDKLEKELQRLEDANNKLNIVTKRLDRMRNLIAQSHYASSMHVAKEKNLKEDNLILLNSRNDNLMIMIEKKMIGAKNYGD